MWSSTSSTALLALILSAALSVPIIMVEKRGFRILAAGGVAIVAAIISAIVHKLVFVGPMDAVAACVRRCCLAGIRSHDADAAQLLRQIQSAPLTDEHTARLHALLQNRWHSDMLDLQRTVADAVIRLLLHQQAAEEIAASLRSAQMTVDAAEEAIQVYDAEVTMMRSGKYPADVPPSAGEEADDEEGNTAENSGRGRRRMRNSRRPRNSQRSAENDEHWHPGGEGGNGHRRRAPRPDATTAEASLADQDGPAEDSPATPATAAQPTGIQPGADIPPVPIPPASALVARGSPRGSPRGASPAATTSAPLQAAAVAVAEQNRGVVSQAPSGNSTTDEECGDEEAKALGTARPVGAPRESSPMRSPQAEPAQSPMSLTPVASPLPTAGIVPIVIRGRRFEGDNPRVCFFIQRSKNANIVVYEARIASVTPGAGGEMDADRSPLCINPVNPLDSFWLDIDPAAQAKARKKGKMDDRVELDAVERGMAYGHNVSNPVVLRWPEGAGGDGDPVGRPVIFAAVQQHSFILRIRRVQLVESVGEAAQPTWLPVLETLIDGRLVIIERAFIKAKGSALPDYIDLVGRDVVTGQEVASRITPQ